MSDKMPDKKDAAAFSRNTDERHIFVQDIGEGGLGYVPNIFPLSSLERISGRDTGTSFLILRSGYKIFVMLPCSVLHQKIYAPDFKNDDMKLVDLSPFTGEALDVLFPRIAGTLMPDGTIYAGRLPGGKPMYVTPKDAPLAVSFNEAVQYADRLNQQKEFGRNDWHVPDIQELQLLYDNRHVGKLSGTFNETGRQYAGFYRTSVKTDLQHAHSINFSTGKEEGGYYQTRPMSLRCVRTG